MGYELDAFIGKAADLHQWEEQLASAVVFELRQSLALVPLTAELMRDISSQLRRKFDSEEELVGAWASQVSRGTAIAFVSASYHGGAGGQTATVWSNQKLMRKDIKINAALQLLGVRAAAPDDEFDTVGLGQFRKIESWVQAAHIRTLAAVARNQSGPAADSAISELAEVAATHWRVEVKSAAACALAEIGGKAIPALAALLAPGKLRNPRHVVVALGKAGPAANIAVPELIRIFKTHPLARDEAVSTLGNIGKEAHRAVPVMIEALQDHSEVIRREAARALGEIGAADKQVIDALKAATQDSDKYVRELSAGALRKILQEPPT
jgi:HEAT repeat protein/PBS lyase HEAT-like repeat-containing protein